MSVMLLLLSPTPGETTNESGFCPHHRSVVHKFSVAAIDISLYVPALIQEPGNSIDAG